MSTIKKYKSKPVTVEAIQFDGKNGKAIVAWVNGNDKKGLDTTARNGGSWVSLTTKYSDGSSHKVTVKKGGYVILYPENYYGAISEELFQDTYVIPVKRTKN